MLLRDYQVDSIDGLRNAFRKGAQRVILCLPTGAGKTFTFCELARRTVTKDPKARVLILTDRIELLYQAGGSLYKTGMTAGVLDAKAKYMPKSQVVVAMVETYFKRAQKGWNIPNLKLIIVDEAHKGNFRKVIELHPNTHIVGATATPVATSKRNPLNLYFHDIVNKIDVAALVDLGFLSSPRYFATAVQVSASISSSTGDYKENELYQDYNKTELYEGCFKNYQLHAWQRKTLIFCVNIAHSENTAREFRKTLPEDQVKYLTSLTPDLERKAILRWFANTPGAVLINCGILTTGFDQPDVECIILNRSTNSLPLYMQMIGRGSRTTETKKEFIVIDMGNNIKKHGCWDDYRDWEDIFRNPSKKRDQVAPIKECPQCESIISPRKMVCPFCGYLFPIKEKEMASEVVTEEFKRTEMQALMRKHPDSLSVQQLIERCKNSKRADGSPYHKNWTVYQLLKRMEPLPLLLEYACLNQYKHPERWAHKQLEIYAEKNKLV
jgi:superfamily II DNA or RNA helicase